MLGDYAIALIEILGSSNAPAHLARRVLVQLIGQWQVTGRLYFLHLVVVREKARLYDEGNWEYITEEIREYLAHAGILDRWNLDHLFSADSFREYGVFIFPVWATILMNITIIDDWWECSVRELPTPAHIRRVTNDDAESDWWENFSLLWTL